MEQGREVQVVHDHSSSIAPNMSGGGLQQQKILSGAASYMAWINNTIKLWKPLTMLKKLQPLMPKQDMYLNRKTELMHQSTARQPKLVV